MEKSFFTHPDTSKVTPSQDKTSLAKWIINKGVNPAQWTAREILSFIGRPPISIVLKDGTAVKAITGETRAKVMIHDHTALWLLLINPEYYFGELYSVGRIEIEGDLVDFLCVISRTFKDRKSTGLRSFLYTLAQKCMPRNDVRKARRNIHHHYDIGNAFYEKWLDRDMQYTCAYFADPDYTLEEAQIAKMHHVCRKLMLQPGQSVVEAGCGWGGLARLMAREYGVNVKAYNISREQVAYARERVRDEGLQDRVEYIEDDYRNIRGEFDVFVSVGMLEHVGIENYTGLGKIINSCLKESGMGLIHTIGRNRPGYLSPWIEKRIFPGACPPSISQMMDIFEPQDFSILDLENLRLHYARTLEHWLSRFNDNINQIRHDFDEEFIRAWRLYLSGSISAFHTGSLQLFQVVFTKATNNALPWSRSHLYSTDQAKRQVSHGRM